MPKTLRVGIIGASAEGGWARDSHVPAVQALEGLDLVAVATNSQATADASARAFGVPKAFRSGLDLVRSPDIDLVAVCTRVPDHHDLVMAALGEGKHVYCEWPLGRGLGEAEEMASAARRSGVHTAIGLQLRGSSAVKRARALMASHAIGRVLSASVTSSTVGFGPNVAAPFLYLEDPENFANLVTIQGAHTVDLSLAVVGAQSGATALLTTQYPEIEVGDTGEKRRRTTFDHLLLQGRLAEGGALSIEVSGGRPPGTPFRFDVVGETGTLALTGGALRGLQSGRLTLSLNGRPQPIDEGELATLSDAAANVGGVYASLRDAIVGGQASTVADFDHAVRLTRLVSDLLAAGAETRTSAAEWPEG